jgi:SAM-dependent methyltransferase
VSDGRIAGSGAGRDSRAALDTSVAHGPRVYDYGLGGKDNFAADRTAGDLALAAYPDIASSIRANRAFLGRAVRYLVDEAGVRQFLDIGMGMPAASNTHEVAQSVAPECKIVYVDNDPVVLAHARALLTSGPAGGTAYIDADLRETRRIIGGAARALDFSRPVAVVLTAVLQHIVDDDDARRIVAELMDAMPPGSYLAISHPAADIEPEAMARMAEIVNRLTGVDACARDQAGVARFFEGLELVEPRLVQAEQWRPRSVASAARATALWCGVARKP